MIKTQLQIFQSNVTFLAFVFAGSGTRSDRSPKLGAWALFGFSAGTTAFFGVPFLVGWAFLWPAIDALAFDRSKIKGRPQL